MKNKTIKEQYQEAFDTVKSMGTVRIKEELDSFGAALKVTKNLYARMGLLSRIAMHERALKDLEAL